MLTLTAIVLALGWAVIRVWNAMSAGPAPKAAPDTGVAKQL